jgi:hypothetical protein
MKKIIFVLLIIFVADKGFAQSGYSLPLPEQWKSETILFPIDFAKSIPYSGSEEIRFTPGWGDAKSNEYWSYTFLWFVDGTPALNADTLSNHMITYFNGLYESNKPKTADSKVVTIVQIKQVATANGDQETYSGKLATLNFLTGQPIRFFITIHVQNYPDAKQSAIFFEISPKPYSNPVWQELDGIVQGFQLQN